MDLLTIALAKQMAGGGFVKIKIPDSVAVQIKACIGNLEAEEVSGTNWFSVETDDEYDAFYSAINEANDAGKLAFIENDDNKVFYSQRTLYGGFGIELLGFYEDENAGVDIYNIVIAWGMIVVDYERRKGTEWQPSE